MAPARTKKVTFSGGKAKTSPAKRSADQDFIMTLESDDEVPNLQADLASALIDSESETETPPISAKKVKGQLAGRQKILDTKPDKSQKKQDTSNHLDINKDFVFDLTGDESNRFGQHVQDWDMSVQGVKGSNKLSVDDIIEKRRRNRPELKLPELQVEDDDDDDEVASQGEVGYAQIDDDEESEDEEDAFGAGARSKKRKAQAQDTDQDEQDPVSSDDEEDQPIEHEQVDFASSDQDEDDKEETEVQKAKKDAFFATEESVTDKKGKKVSKPQTDQEESVTFSSLDLSRPLLRALSTLSFHTPTPIQARTVPLALAGKDLVAGAVTGSGKTAAFMIPILERLNWRPKGGQEAKSRVLVLAPTRELAIQCFSVGKSLAKFMDVRFCLCVGGLSLKSQETELKLRPEVIIATPGRLIDHTRNSASFTLDDIEILVMDEADRMLEDGFADELNEIVSNCPKGRQTMLFSATMTDDVERLVGLSLRKPVRLFVDPKRTTAKRLIQEFVRVRGAAAGGVAASYGLIETSNKSEEAHRPALLLSLCTRTFTCQVIIFVRSKKLAHQLKIVFGLLGLSAGELHGDLSQEGRLEALESFRDGKVDYLIATDLASRGLDIRGVQTVINYDMPQQFEQYLHRVGRTARAGRNGRAVTLVGEADRKVLKLALKKSDPEQVKHRLIPPEVVASMIETMDKLKPEVDKVLKEEQEEKAIRQAEMELRKGENIIKHKNEIMSRPRRTWFQSEKDKEAAKDMSKAEHAAKMPAKDRFAGLSRKKKRSKMMREEVKAEKSQGNVDASIRAAKKSQRPKALGVPEPKRPRKGGGKKKVGAGKKSVFAKER